MSCRAPTTEPPYARDNATITSMASQPLKQIYFDTNILYRWPHPPNDIYSIFGVARWLGTKLYMPEVVERELEAQFIRSVNAAYDAAEKGLREVSKLCHQVITTDFQGSRPNDEQLRDAFRKRSDELKKHFGISTAPLPALDVSMLVDMAINRAVPFEAKVVGDDEIVAGLQDTAILLSVLDHMKTAAATDRCAIITADKVFQKAATKKLIQSKGCKLELFKKVGDLFSDLFSHVWDATRTAWYDEMKQIEASLNEQKDDLSQKIFASLQASEVGPAIWKRAKEVTDFTITQFLSILTELPETEHRPPNADTYKRPEGSDVKISAKVFSRTEAIVEAVNWSNLFLLSGVQSGIQPVVDTTPKLEDASFHETLNVSLTGTVKNGVIGDFQVTGVELHRP